MLIALSNPTSASRSGRKHRNSTENDMSSRQSDWALSLQEDLRSLQILPSSEDRLKELQEVSRRLSLTYESRESLLDPIVSTHRADKKRKTLTAEESANAFEKRQTFANVNKSQDEEPDLFKFLAILAAHELPLIPIPELRYEDTDTIGAPRYGAFGEVRRAHWYPQRKRPIPVAVKGYKDALYSKSHAARENDQYNRLMHDVFFEVEIMGRCNHANIANILGVAFADSAIGDENVQVKPLLVLEAADMRSPDLFSFFSSGTKGMELSNELLLGIVLAVADGLQFLHHVGVIHADLKPQNILMFDGPTGWIPKLTDFGLSGIGVSNDNPRGGTRRWNPPECLDAAPPEMSIFSSRPTRDIYSFGLVTAFIFLRGESPFAASVRNVDEVKLNGEDSAAEHIWSAVQIALAESPLISRIHDLLFICLKKNPQTRLQNIAGVNELGTGQQLQRSRTLQHWQSSQRSDEIPFRSSHLTHALDFQDLQTLFEHKEFIPLLSQAQDFPPSFKKALSIQLERLASSKPPSELTLAQMAFCLVLIPPEKYDAIIAVQPQYESLRNFPLTSLQNFLMQRLESQKLRGNLRERLLLSSFEVILRLDRELRPSNDQQGFTNMHLAAVVGNKKLIESVWIQDPGALDDQQNSFRWSPLHCAIHSGSSEAISTLLKLGAKVNSQSGGQLGWTWTPLMLAVLKNRIGVVRALLRDPCIDVWSKDSGFMGFSSAHYAAEMSNNDSLEALLDFDRGVAKAKDERRRTPLHRAALVGNFKGVDLLIRYGANIQAIDTGHETALHRAYAFGNGFQAYQVIDDTNTILKYLKSKKRTDAKYFDQTTSLVQANIVNFPLQAQEMLRKMGASFSMDIPDLLTMSWISSWDRLSEETPLEHDPFILMKRHQMPGCDWLYDTLGPRMMARSVDPSLPLEDWEQWAIHGTFGEDNKLQSFEWNVRVYAQNNRRKKFLMSGERVPGQNGVTFLPLPAGQMIVKRLLEAGANPKALNNHGYTPECFAYKPEELLLDITINVGEDTRASPASVTRKLDLPLSMVEPDLAFWDESPSSKQIDFSRANFTIWKWIPNALPCPSDALLFARGGRYPWIGQDPETVDHPIEIEIRMCPPNDANNEESVLFYKKSSSHELFPEPDRAYVLYLGLILLKHKCHLLINIRSIGEPGSISGGLIFSTLRLVARGKISELSSPIASWPLHIHESQDKISNSAPLGQDHLQPARLPKFAKGKYWLPCGAAARPDPALRDPSLEEMMGHMSLREPNPNVFTRRRLGLNPESKLDGYGEKTWHYDEEKADTPYGEMKDISDGTWKAKYEDRKRRLAEFCRKKERLEDRLRERSARGVDASDLENEREELRKELKAL